MHSGASRRDFLVAASASCAGMVSACRSMPVVRANTPPDALRKYPAMRVRVQLNTGANAFTVKLPERSTLTTPDGTGMLPPGTYRVEAASLQAAKQRFHVFPKTFARGEHDEMATYLADWKARGYPMLALPRGRRFQMASGAAVDNRVFWMSLNRFAEEAQARALVKQLQAESVWAWVRAERVQAGGGRVQLRKANGESAGEARLPFTLPAVSAAELTPEGGLGNAGTYTGALSFEAGPDGKLEAYLALPFEEYLRGVLPAEMPASWPHEALCAQAIAARSDTLAHLGLKYDLEGFDYCNTETSRVFKGEAVRQASTDTAVAATAGTVLTDGRRLIPAVFSSNAGGWTAANETAWSAPPDPALRPVPEFPADSNPAPRGPLNYGIGAWLANTPKAFSASDARFFRWTRTFSSAEMSATVNKRHKVGRVRRIELGDRASCGRLEWIRIHGADGAVTVRKELPIRLSLGSLPSALFILKAEAGAQGASRFTFTGGGRGHGVGLSQYGAYGMAQAGYGHRAILTHYYTGVDLERIEAVGLDSTGD